MHGANRQGINTTAKLNFGLKEFRISSNKLGNAKIENVGLVKSADVAIVWADLEIENKSCGIHPFIVPIRNSNYNKN